MAWRLRDRIFEPATPSAPVVSLADMKKHLRVDDTHEDTLIEGDERAAVLTVEAWTQRLLTLRQAVLRLSVLPPDRMPLELPGGRVGSLTSVVIDGEPLTGCVFYGQAPARLFPPTDWPAVSAPGFPVAVTYQAGYAVVPADLVKAVMLIAGSLYRDRENAAQGSMAPVAVTAEYLMRPYRIRPL